MSGPFKNVAIFGANGLLGEPLVDELKKMDQIHVTLLVRDAKKTPTRTDKSTLSRADKVVEYKMDAAGLTKLLKGQDAVIILFGQGASLYTDVTTIIDASIAAGVQRVVIPEHTGNFNVDAAEQLLIFNEKRKYSKYVRARAAEGKITYSGVTNGSFIDWGLDNGFLGFNFANKTVTTYGGGEHEYAATTLDTVGRALAGIIKNPAGTKNKSLKIADEHISHKELIALIEKESGEKWTVTDKDGSSTIASGIERLKKGDYSGIADIIVPAHCGSDPQFKEISSWPEEAAENAKILGLKPVSMQEVVRKQLRSAKA